MRDRPSGAELLHAARSLLLDALLEQLPEAQRYRARLIANAMAVAARELAAGDGPWSEERRRLAALRGEAREVAGSARWSDSESLDEALQRLNWWLAAEIRGGRRDGDPATHAVLRENALARLEQTNPKAPGGSGER